MLIVTGFLYLAPYDVAAFMTDLANLSVLSRQREGYLLYAAAVEDASIARLLVAECWQDEVAFAAHLQSQATTAFMDRWEGRMSADLQRYDVSSASPLLVE